MGMFRDFEGYMYGLIGMNGSITNMIKNLTEKLVKLRQQPNLTEIMEIKPNKLVPGRFYLIQYNYNGNYIWCPILALEYKVIKNNHILYAINLEYLPPKFKIAIFNKIFKAGKEKLDKITQKEFVREEQPMKFMTFEFMYKLLKDYKMNWAITAYTIKDFTGNFKIKKSYLCSLKIAPEIIMADMKRYNSKNMIELQKSLAGEDSIKMSKIIEDYQLLIESYQEDSIEYHKKVALFKEKLKLFKD